MGRPEKPLPAEAPAALRAYAGDLRRLRHAAGMTYDELADRAGYPKSRLSEAASGRQLASASVTRAYVGACGGSTADQAAWVRRLQLLRDDPDVLRWLGARRVPAYVAAATSTLPTAAAADLGPNGAATAVAAPHPAAVTRPGAVARSERRGRTGPRRPRRRLRPLAVSATLLPALLVGALVAAARPDPAARDQGFCPAPVPDAGFTGSTRAAGAVIRTGAGLRFPILRRVSGNCDVSFSGYCVGQPVTDAVAHLPDTRWFRVAGGPGVIASATIHGNPPRQLTRPCRGEHRPPAALTMLDPPYGRLTGSVRLRAQARGVAMVGFAAYYSSAAGSDPRWQQVAVATAGQPLTARWNTAAMPPQAPSALIRVAAVACLAGGAPTRVMDVHAYRPPGGGRLSRPPVIDLVGADRRAAAHAACRYPARTPLTGAAPARPRPSVTPSALPTGTDPPPATATSSPHGVAPGRIPPGPELGSPGTSSGALRRAGGVPGGGNRLGSSPAGGALTRALAAPPGGARDQPPAPPSSGVLATALAAGSGGSASPRRAGRAAAEQGRVRDVEGESLLLGEAFGEVRHQIPG